MSINRDRTKDSNPLLEKNLFMLVTFGGGGSILSGLAALVEIIMTESIDNLVYESRGTPKSLWNTYRIFNDRIELQFRIFFTKIIIPKDTFVKVDVYKPPVIRTAFWALKIDLADLYTHVGVERNSGIFKKIRFTSSNPPANESLTLTGAKTPRQVCFNVMIMEICILLFCFIFVKLACLK